MKKYFRKSRLLLMIVFFMAHSFTVVGAEDVGSWSNKASLLTARANFGVAKANGKIYALGGWDDTILFDTVEEYDPITNAWSTKANMPTARCAFGTAEYNGKIYAIGGGNLTDNNLDTVEEYDPITDTWTAKASMPTGRNYLSVIEANGKIYAMGGKNAGSILNTVEEYNPITDTWITKASMPTPRHYFAIAEYQDKIYAISGYNTICQPTMTVDEYDPQTDTWTSKASLPTYGSEAGEVNGKIYFCGSDNKLYEYDIEADNWIKKNNIPFTRTYKGVVKANGELYVIGGQISGGGVLDVVYAYTPPSTVITVDVPLNLVAQASDTSISLNWDAVPDADSYTILRSTTSGTVDVIIASGITATTYTDTNVTPGVTYYYVVRAVKNGQESADSNIASSMIEDNSNNNDNNRALLLIKLLDENDKEYDLTKTDVDAFMNWYTDRSTGQETAYYVFTKDYNAGPYVSRKDYITYDKIICIEVNEYTK